MPTWRADYFDKSGDPAPARSVILEAESESDALDGGSQNGFNLYSRRANPDRL